jgi:hypothetical protein
VVRTRPHHRFGNVEERSGEDDERRLGVSTQIS